MKLSYTKVKQLETSTRHGDSDCVHECVGSTRHFRQSLQAYDLRDRSRIMIEYTIHANATSKCIIDSKQWNKVQSITI